jgi:SAM-dependent methyltransferase
LNTSEELSFWRNIIDNCDKDYVSSIHVELRDFLKDLLGLPPGGYARILDVGSGPITKLGTEWEGRILDLILVDPLANEYNRMLDYKGLRTYPRPIKGFAETLIEQFGFDVFDMVYSQNALDHAINPSQGIREMLGVAKPSGIVAFNVVANEGCRNGYAGLHQWDFNLRDGKVYLRSASGAEQSLDEICGDLAVYSAEIKVEPVNNTPTDFIYVVLRKKKRDFDLADKGVKSA